MINYLVYLAARCNGYHPSFTRSITDMSLTGGLMCGVGDVTNVWVAQAKGYAEKRKKDENLHGV